MSASEIAPVVDVEALLVRVGGGDRGALVDLYDATAPRLFGLVLRVVADRGLAEDTMQEVYLQVWRHARSFDPEYGSGLSWLLTIAHRRAVDRVRSETAARRRVERDSTSRVWVVPDLADEVVEGIARDQEISNVHRCMDELTDRQRESIELAYLNGLTYRQVAENLEVALPTVKSRIRDGLRRLRSCLGGARA